MANTDNGSLTGMSAGEARDFHRIFMKSTIAFTGWAFAAHLLVWFWRPWTANTDGTYSSLMDGVQTVAALLPSIT